MKLIGLTGGIGSGKSTVARMLSEAGVVVVDADQLARDAVAPGSEGLAAIVEAFGTKMLTSAGELDRAKMAEVVFADEGKRRALNTIVHPQVAQLAAERIAAQREAGAEVAVYEVPLLFENELQGAMDATILVATDEKTQLERIVERDGLDTEQAKKRISAQMALSEKRALADHVIENDGTLEQLRADVETVWKAVTGHALGV